MNNLILRTPETDRKRVGIPQYDEDLDGKVLADYYPAAGQNFLDSTNVKVVFDTKVADTHSAVVGSKFTVPAKWPGTYFLSATLTFNAVPVAAGAFYNLFLMVYKNGSVFRGSVQTPPTNKFGSITLTCFVDCQGGDTLEIYAYQASGSTIATIATSLGAAVSWWNIHRLWDDGLVAQGVQQSGSGGSSGGISPSTRG